MNHGGELVRYSLMPSTQNPPHYGALLVVLLILLVVAPTIDDRAGYGVELFFDLVLIVGAYSAAWRSRHRFPFLALTVVTLGMRWADMALGRVGFSTASIALVVLWLSYAVGLIVVALFRMEKVSTNAILGAIVAYVLSAVAFSSSFELIERLQPSSFSGLPVGSTAADVGSALLYFDHDHGIWGYLASVGAGSFGCQSRGGLWDSLPCGDDRAAGRASRASR